MISFGLLAFAGLDQVQVRTLAVEQHVAEKVDAYTRTYARGRASSHVKDLVDIDIIAGTTRIDSARLRAALDARLRQARNPPDPLEAAAPTRELGQHLVEARS